jgi:outer membrane protein assembly factor BamE (lipoprotein component of BamABCDE complex)
MRIFSSTRCVALIAALALCASSCALTKSQTHMPIPADDVMALQPGDSAARVTELLGAPTEVVQLGRRSAYRYDFTETKRAGLWLFVIGFLNTDSQQDRVWVFLDENDNVSHVGATLDGTRAEWSMPWSDRDDE